MRRLLLSACCCLLFEPALIAADTWIEVKSPHFTVISNAGEGSTRRLVWQLEQVRSAMAAIWSWARVDLNKPLVVLAAKDENTMRALAPKYWEQRGGVRPTSVWVTAPDRHYLAIRTDVEGDDRQYLNPHITAYFSYAALVLGQSLSPDLPLWFSRGFTGVLSNTIVRDDFIVIGAPIPWNLERLREGKVLRLSELLTIIRRSPELTRADGLELFDAEAWALVHFFMFADNGMLADKLNAFARLVSNQREPSAAFVEAFGPAEALEASFRAYVSRSLYSMRKYNVDAAVGRERLPVRRLTPAESASARALLHAAMGRPVEGRAAIAEARKADPELAASYEAEAALFDRENQAAARAAYARAVELGTTSEYTHYRLASLTWRPVPDRDTLVAIEKLLTRAVQLNNRYADAYAWLGEVRTGLGEDGLGMIRRAITLDPLEPGHHLRAARVLLRQGKPEDARVEAQAGLSLARDDDDRREAQRLLETANKG